MALAKLPSDEQHLEDRFREYIRVPRSIAEAYRKWLARRPTGSFEIHAQDGVVKSSTDKNRTQAGD